LNWFLARPGCRGRRGSGRTSPATPSCRRRPGAGTKPSFSVRVRREHAANVVRRSRAAAPRTTS
jgi:hypothetical protein